MVNLAWNIRPLIRRQIWIRTNVPQDLQVEVLQLSSGFPTLHAKSATSKIADAMPPLLAIFIRRGCFTCRRRRGRKSLIGRWPSTNTWLGCVSTIVRRIIVIDLNVVPFLDMTLPNVNKNSVNQLDLLDGEGHVARWNASILKTRRALQNASNEVPDGCPLLFIMFAMPVDVLHLSGYIAVLTPHLLTVAMPAITRRRHQTSCQNVDHDLAARAWVLLKVWARSSGIQKALITISLEVKVTQIGSSQRTVGLLNSLETRTHLAQFCSTADCAIAHAESAPKNDHWCHSARCTVKRGER